MDKPQESAANAVDPPAANQAHHPPAKGQAGTLRVYLALTLPAILAIAVFSLAESSSTIFALSTLIGACAFALGALLGFLFGIPQYFAVAADARADSAHATYQPNTNLTQVSDWLTKIIIGVGLVQFGQLTDTIGRLGDSLEPSLGGDEAGKAFGIALVVGFFVIGFLVGYLYTRLRLQWAFASADRGAFEQAVQDVAEGVAEKKIEQQAKADAEALKLASKQLDPDAERLSRGQLKAALAEASPAAKEQVRMQAQGEKPSSQSQPPSERARAVLEAIDEASEEEP
jgi:hypothetical protein